MKATVKVSQLVTDDGKYRRGDILDLTKDRIKALGSSVEQIVPTIEVIDNRDEKIAELEATVKTISDANAAKDAEITKLKKEISSRQREIQKLLKEK